MIIPPDASADMVKALRDIDQRLRTLERPVPDSAQGLSGRLLDAENDIRTLKAKPQWQDPNDVFQGGQISIESLKQRSVDGGIEAKAGGWDARIASKNKLIFEAGHDIVIIPGDGAFDPSKDETSSSGHNGALTLDSDVGVTGSLFAAALDAKEGRFRRLIGTSLFARGYGGTPVAGGNGNIGTGDTKLSGYKWFLDGKMLGADGDAIEVVTVCALLNTVAGTKTFRQYVNNQSVTVFTTASTVSTLRILSRFVITRRSLTTAALNGFTVMWDQNVPGVLVEFYGANSSFASLDFSVNQPIEMSLQQSGGTDNTIILTDVSARPVLSHDAKLGV